MSKTTELNKTWDTGIKLIDKPIITIPQSIVNKIEGMSRTMGNCEWGGYLLGDGLNVTDIIVTKQSVTATEWETIEPPTQSNVIGTAHSHHNMTSFTSGTDLAYVCMNYPVTIIYSYQDGCKAWYTSSLPDGNKFIVDADLEITESQDVTKWIVENIDKIQERKKEPVKYKYPQYSGKLTPPNDDIPYSHNTDEAIKYDYIDFGCDECASKSPTTIHLSGEGLQYCDDCYKVYKNTNRIETDHRTVVYTKTDE